MNELSFGRADVNEPNNVCLGYCHSPSNTFSTRAVRYSLDGVR